MYTEKQFKLPYWHYAIFCYNRNSPKLTTKPDDLRSIQTAIRMWFWALQSVENVKQLWKAKLQTQIRQLSKPKHVALFLSHIIMMGDGCCYLYTLSCIFHHNGRFWIFSLKICIRYSTDIPIQLYNNFSYIV